MAYALKSQDKIVGVETFDTLTLRDRESITTQLSEMAAFSAIQGLIIDHQKAAFDLTLEDAAIFAESIVRLHAIAPLHFICVIVSEPQRFIIDASISIAASRGVPIRAYENRHEVSKDIARKFPHIRLPAPKGKLGGDSTPPSPFDGATEIECRQEKPTRASAQYFWAPSAIQEKNKPNNGVSQVSEKKELSPRESECLLAAAYGLTEKETARLLGISHNTVSVHIANCREKLGARNKLDAVVKGLGLIKHEAWCRLCSLSGRGRKNMAPI